MQANSNFHWYRCSDSCLKLDMANLFAAAARRQPFLMHKMAFHRARVLSIVERTLGPAAGQWQRPPNPKEVRMLSDNIAPPMQPDRAEVFLPYSLPGKTFMPWLASIDVQAPHC